MGYMIYREVKRYAPDDLDTGELALLLILADDADEDTRECFPGIDELCTWMRMSADGIGKIFKRLAARDLEVRVVVDKDKAGRPVYARKGLRTTYRIPVFKPAALAGPASGLTAKARTTVRPKATDRPDHSPGNTGLSPDHSPPKAGPQSGPSPQFPQEEDPPLPQAQRIVRNAGLGLAEEEEEEFIAWANHPDQKGPHVLAWWEMLAAKGDLPVQVTRWRTAHAAAQGRDSPPVRSCASCGETFIPTPGNKLCCTACQPGRTP